MCPVLYGGRKPRLARKIQRGKRLGGSYEGDIFESAVTIRKHGKTRAITLAEKQFYAPEINPLELIRKPNEELRNPRKQFEVMTELKRLNAQKKLGLHILPTIRLRRTTGRRQPTIFSTRYKEIDPFTLDWPTLEKAVLERRREKSILLDLGYNVYFDAWKLIEDPVTKKPTCYIADFGGVEKIKHAPK